MQNERSRSWAWWASRWLRTWLVPGLDEDAQRTRKGRLAGALYLAADVYAACVTVQTWENEQARLPQLLIVAGVAVLGLTLLLLPWHRFRDSVLIWPVLPSAFLLNFGEGLPGVLGHYQPVYMLSLGYAGLVLRPGRTTALTALNLALLGVVAGLGRQQEHLVELVGTILFAGVIGEMIAAAIWTQKRQRSDLEQLHAGLRPLLQAQTESDAARLISELAMHVLRADGVFTMVSERPIPGFGAGDSGPPADDLVARGGAGIGADFSGVRLSVGTDPSGAAVAARSRRHLYVADALSSPLVSRQYVARVSARSLLYVPILVGDRLVGVMVIWWTRPVSDLDHFTDQVIELLSIQAGPVLERVRQVEELDRAAMTDSLTGVGNRRAFEQALQCLADDAVLVLFDLDKFKALNDSQGHPAGDRVLRAFAAALAGSVRDTDLVCRFGGDEFAVIARGDGAVARAVLERLASVWSAPEGVGFSAGYAVRQVGEAPALLNARADEALYAEKNLRRGRSPAG
ncbi:hypothetical protein Kisp01_40210 [Kineosporia sp. NBRC 101677]|uniref:sensor domain-containing diguanylate cyclase n=1 Tax=Kineosporia sp. NBRC 101677 TaxID=3032197 RepID=UPI0024A0CF6A|nr:sensor domain-containing diguanylate cyclase [Kineosporia sp. NBRC 101677]GLY17006.1 hypothetical protein Kisp01_40210 [Kineosporia sp. NBRC 101677]